MDLRVRKVQCIGTGNTFTKVKQSVKDKIVFQGDQYEKEKLKY